MNEKRGRGLTALQRQALECVRGAKAKGLSLSAYCRARGVAVRQVYDALIPLRRHGLLAGRSTRKPARAWKSKASAARFVAVQIDSPRTLITCRVTMASGISIECAQWPPRAWLESLGATDGIDAAP